MLATKPISAAAAPPNRAARALVEAHADFVFRTLGRFGVEGADLADLSQEVFIVALRRTDREVPDDKLRPWLFGIARRVAAGHRRRAHRRYEALDDGLDDREVSPRPSPEALTQERQARDALAGILQKMTLEQRAVFTMFEIEGMTGAEIAEAIGRPVQTVFTRLRRAREVFQREADRLQRGGSR